MFRGEVKIPETRAISGKYAIRVVVFAMCRSIFFAEPLLSLKILKPGLAGMGKYMRYLLLLIVLLAGCAGNGGMPDAGDTRRNDSVVVYRVGRVEVSRGDALDVYIARYPIENTYHLARNVDFICRLQHDGGFVILADEKYYFREPFHSLLQRRQDSEGGENHAAELAELHAATIARWEDGELRFRGRVLRSSEIRKMGMRCLKHL